MECLVASEHFVNGLELTGLVCTEEAKQRIGDRLGARKVCPRRTRAEDAIGREQRRGSPAIASVQCIVQGANGCGGRFFLCAHARKTLQFVTSGNGGLAEKMLRWLPHSGPGEPPASSNLTVAILWQPSGCVKRARASSSGQRRSRGCRR